MGGERVVLVTVDALQGDRDAVDEKAAVLDLHLAEADLAACRFEDRARAVLEGQQKAVKVGRLGRPFFRGGQEGVEDGGGGGFPVHVHGAGGPGQDRPAAGVEELQIDDGAAGAQSGEGVPEVDGHVQTPVRVFFVQGRIGPKIADMELGRGREIDVAFDAAQAEEILAFEVGAVRPAQDL